MKPKLPQPPASYRRSHVVLAPVLKRMHLSCEHYSDLSLQAMDRPLTFGEKFRLLFHHLACGLCRDFNKQMKALNALVKRAFSEKQSARPDPAFLDSVRGRLTEIADEEGTAQSPD